LSRKGANVGTRQVTEKQLLSTLGDFLTRLTPKGTNIQHGFRDGDCETSRSSLNDPQNSSGIINDSKEKEK
jgi:hypothetical protein